MRVGLRDAAQQRSSSSGAHGQRCAHGCRGVDEQAADALATREGDARNKYRMSPWTLGRGRVSEWARTVKAVGGESWADFGSGAGRRVIGSRSGKGQQQERSCCDGRLPI